MLSGRKGKSREKTLETSKLYHVDQPVITQQGIPLQIVGVVRGNFVSGLRANLLKALQDYESVLKLPATMQEFNWPPQ